MRTIKAWTILAAVLALAGCESPTAEPISSAAHPGDVAFVTTAYQIIQFDQAEGAQAKTQARDPRVKALAARLVDEADQFKAQLAPVAKNAGVQPPNILRQDLRVRLGHMQIQRGLDFDRTYLDDQIASHQEALDAQETMVNSSNTTPAVRALAQHGEVLVRQNLQALKALRQDMGS